MRHTAACTDTQHGLINKLPAGFGIRQPPPAHLHDPVALETQGQADQHRAFFQRIQRCPAQPETRLRCWRAGHTTVWLARAIARLTRSSSAGGKRIRLVPGMLPAAPHHAALAAHPYIVPPLLILFISTSASTGKYALGVPKPEAPAAQGERTSCVTTRKGERTSCVTTPPHGPYVAALFSVSLEYSTVTEMSRAETTATPELCTAAAAVTYLGLGRLYCRRRPPRRQCGMPCRRQGTCRGAQHGAVSQGTVGHVESPCDHAPMHA